MISEYADRVPIKSSNPARIRDKALFEVGIRKKNFAGESLEVADPRTIALDAEYASVSHMQLHETKAHEDRSNHKSKDYPR